MGLLPVTCILGVCFSVTILLIFLKPSFKSHIIPSTLIYLIGLAIADLHNSFLIAPLGFTRCIAPASSDIQFFYNIYEKYVKNLGNIFTTTGILITLTITVERFVFLVKSKGDVPEPITKRPVRSAIKILTAIFISSAGCCVPLFLYFDDVSAEQPVQRSQFAETTEYEVYAWYRLLVVKLTPMFTISVLNIALVKNIRDNNRRLKAMVFSTTVYKRRMQAQNKLTVMLLSISAVFVLGHLIEPFMDTSIFTSLFGDCSIETLQYETIRMFGNWVESLTWASNFVSYYVFNSTFRYQLNNLAVCGELGNSTHGTKFRRFNYAMNTKVGTEILFRAMLCRDILQSSIFIFVDHF